MLIDSFLLGGHAYQAHTKTYTVLDLFSLTTIGKAIHQELECFGRILVAVDQTISIISACRRIWGVLLVAVCDACEVGVQNVFGFTLVTLVDHTKGSNAHEAVPIGGTSDPAVLILQEGVIGCISVHYTITPNCR